MSYASVLSIRKGAGLQNKVDNEKPLGMVDGSNTLFTVKKRPIADRDGDDIVTKTDVTVLVDGAPATVTLINARTGAITLSVAPTADADIVVDYDYSPLSYGYVNGKQAEADSWIDLKVKATITKPALITPINPTPPLISTVAELYAAGLILVRDWGDRSDTELTSKDGYAKMNLARKLIQDYIDGVLGDRQNADNSAGADTVSVKTDGDVFSRRNTEHDFDDEDHFMRPGACQ